MRVDDEPETQFMSLSFLSLTHCSSFERKESCVIGRRESAEVEREKRAKSYIWIQCQLSQFPYLYFLISADVRKNMVGAFRRRCQTGQVRKRCRTIQPHFERVGLRYATKTRQDSHGSDPILIVSCSRTTQIDLSLSKMSDEEAGEEMHHPTATYTCWISAEIQLGFLSMTSLFVYKCYLFTCNSPVSDTNVLLTVKSDLREPCFIPPVFSFCSLWHSLKQ